MMPCRALISARIFYAAPAPSSLPVVDRRIVEDERAHGERGAPVQTYVDTFHDPAASLRRRATLPEGSWARRLRLAAAQ